MNTDGIPNARNTLRVSEDHCVMKKSSKLAFTK